MEQETYRPQGKLGILFKHGTEAALFLLIPFPARMQHPDQVCCVNSRGPVVTLNTP